MEVNGHPDKAHCYPLGLWWLCYYKTDSSLWLDSNHKICNRSARRACVVSSMGNHKY